MHKQSHIKVLSAKKQEYMTYEGMVRVQHKLIWEADISVDRDWAHRVPHKRKLEVMERWLKRSILNGGYKSVDFGIGIATFSILIEFKTDAQEAMFIFNVS